MLEAPNLTISGASWNLETLALAELTSIPTKIEAVITSGYYTAGDGGGAMYKRVVSQPSHPGKWQDLSGAWFELVGTTISPEVFGADGIDDTTAINNTILYLYAVCSGKGGVVSYTEGRTYYASSIQNYPGVSHCGASAATSTEVNSQWNGARIKQIANANAPLFYNNPNVGYIRNISNVDGQPQRYVSCSISNLTFMGELGAGYTTACSLIQLNHAWNVTISDVSLFASKGFGLALLDCNNIITTRVSAVYAPIFIDDCADCIINATSFGGNNFVNSSIWISGFACQGNQFSGLYGNNRLQSTSGTGGYIAVSSVDTVTEEITLASPHSWTVGVPIVLAESTVAAIGGTVVSQTYYVIPGSTSSKLKLATTRYNALNNIPLDLTSSGTSVSLGIGYDANVVLNSGAVNNQIGPMRSDQAYGDGILCINSYNNVFSSLTIYGSGMDNITAKSGLRLSTSSTGNVIGSAIINGVKLTSGVMVSNQKYGISSDLTSIIGLNIATSSVNCLNHTVANSVAGAENYNPYSLNPNLIVLGTANFNAVSGTPVVGLFGGGRRNGWLMTTGESIGAIIKWPAGYKNVRIRASFVNAGAGAGNVSFGLNFGYFSVGTNLNVADPASSAIATVTAGVQDVYTETLFGDMLLSDTNAYEPMFLRCNRNASGDTLANDIALFELSIEPLD